MKLGLVRQPVPFSLELRLGYIPGCLSVGVSVDGVSKKNKQVRLCRDNSIPNRLMLPLLVTRAKCDARDSAFREGGRSFSEEAETDTFGIESTIAAINAKVRLAPKISDRVILILYKPRLIERLLICLSVSNTE